MTNRPPDVPSSWKAPGSVLGDGPTIDPLLGHKTVGPSQVSTADGRENSCLDRLAAPLAKRLVAYQRRLEPRRPVRLIWLGHPAPALLAECSRRLAAAGGSCQLTVAVSTPQTPATGGPPMPHGADDLVGCRPVEHSGAITVRYSQTPAMQLLYPGAADAVVGCRSFDALAESAAQRLVHQLWRAQPSAVWVVQASSHPLLLLLRRRLSRGCRRPDAVPGGAGRQPPPPRWSARRVRQLLREAGFLPTATRYAWPGVWLVEARLQWVGQPVESWWGGPSRNANAARPAAEGLIGRGPS